MARTISDSITTLKNDSLERRHYMTWAVKMADARYDGYDEGYEEGISIGLERGAYQNKLETARSMLDYDDAPEKVALCTGLPMEIVLKLIG